MQQATKYVGVSRGKEFAIKARWLMGLLRGATRLTWWSQNALSLQVNLNILNLKIFLFISKRMERIV
jgi:hypothetical protein